MTPRTVIVVLDGLRADALSAEGTPTLMDLARRGVRFLNHHCCLPSMTRVNSASLATGCNPGRHGIVDNMLRPAGGDGAVNTGDRRQLIEVDQATGGRLLEAASLTEIFGRSGRQVAVASSCSSGACFLQNHRSFGVTYNNGWAWPAGEAEAIAARLGPVPPDASPNIGRNEYATAVLTENMLERLRPDLSILWLSDPDHTQHAFDVGSGESSRAVRHVDACVGRVLAALDRLRLADETNVLVVSDHGFISHRGGAGGLVAALVAAGLKESAESGDVRRIGCGIHLSPQAADRLGDVVRLLQGRPGTGAIFTRRPVEGALPLRLIGCEHERSPDILLTPAWSAEANEHGVAGVAASGGLAAHGGGSPWEMQVAMLAAGPSFRAGLADELPTGNIDILPTVLATAGVAAGAEPDGRVLAEALVDGDSPAAAADRRAHEAAAKLPAGRYEAAVEILSVGPARYVHQAGGGLGRAAR